MNQIDVVVDVRQSPDSAELIVSKQKLAFSGEASLIGSIVETRIVVYSGDEPIRRVSSDCIPPVDGGQSTRQGKGEL